MIKPTILEIDNVRVIKWDENNYVVQREETYFSPINQMDVTSYVFKGCYATLQACFKAIHVKGLLIDENSVQDLNGLLKQIDISNQKVIDAIERVETNE